ncbi:hypothetical protein [Oceanobacillus halophilus]|uniref:hypothetical protein n=1 Tax=Oceanobacillus halophilus TaxID=930130 RepID=UPI001313FE57|nr:hypothetical protein [Oceanobacillus halophilus]
MGDMRKLTQQELQEILNKICTKGYQSRDMSALKLIEEIKRNLLFGKTIDNQNQSIRE